MEMVAKLELDASEYVSEINAIGKQSEAAFKGVAASGRQAEDAVDGVGKQAKSTADRIEESFGHVRSFERLFGAFALLHTAIAGGEGLFAVMEASSKKSSAAMEGDFLGVIKADKEMVEAEQQMLRSLPVLGGVFAAGLNAEKRAFDEEIKDIDSVEKATAKMESQAVKLHEESVLEKMKLDGASDADILAKKLGFEEDKRKTELEKDEEMVSIAAKLAAKADQDRKDHLTAIHTIDPLTGEDFWVKAQAKLDATAAAAQQLYSRAMQAYQADQAAITETSANDQRQVWQKESDAREKEEKRINDEAVKEQESAAKRAETAERKREEDEKKYNRDQALSNKQDKERLSERAKSYAGHPEAAQMAAGEDYFPPYHEDPAVKEFVNRMTIGQQFPTIDHSPSPAPARDSHGKASITINTTINPPPNLDQREIARMVASELERLLKRGVFSLAGH